MPYSRLPPCLRRMTCKHRLDLRGRYGRHVRTVPAVPKRPKEDRMSILEAKCRKCHVPITTSGQCVCTLVAKKESK
jgi:hypothetical protein